MGHPSNDQEVFVIWSSAQVKRLSDKAPGVAVICSAAHCDEVIWCSYGHSVAEQEPCAPWGARNFVVSFSSETISSSPAGKCRKPDDINVLQWPWAGALLPGDGLDYFIGRRTKRYPKAQCPGEGSNT